MRPSLGNPAADLAAEAVMIALPAEGPGADGAAAIHAGKQIFQKHAVRIKSDRMNLSRRDLALAIAALTTTSASAETLPKLGSQIHPYDKLPVRHNGAN